VYITEAHAADEWPVGARISFTNQTRSVEERRVLATRFATDFGLSFPLLIDSMANGFMDAFAAWPMRFYIVKGGKVVLRAMPGQGEGAYGYDASVLSDWLAANVA